MRSNHAVVMCSCCKFLHITLVCCGCKKNQLGWCQQFVSRYFIYTCKAWQHLDPLSLSRSLSICFSLSVCTTEWREAARGRTVPTATPPAFHVLTSHLPLKVWTLSVEVWREWQDSVCTCLGIESFIIYMKHELSYHQEGFLFLCFQLQTEHAGSKAIFINIFILTFNQ